MTEVTFSPAFDAAVNALHASTSDALAKRLVEALKLRVSHINGCHYCIDLHGTALKRMDVDAPTIAALERPIKWAKPGMFTDAEVAAIRFAEVLTDYPRGIEAEAREAAAEHFSPEEVSAIAEHTLMINLWNRWTRAND